MKTIEIRRITAGEWPHYKQLRLRALELAADAYGGKLSDAVKTSDAQWQERALRFSQDADMVSGWDFLKWDATRKRSSCSLH